MVLMLAVAGYAQDLTVDLVAEGLPRGCIVLSSRFGTPVVFEGAPPSSTTEEIFRTGDLQSMRSALALRFTYPQGATAQGAAERMVAEWNSRHDGADYTVTTQGSAVHVRPITGSVLDIEITLPAASGTPTALVHQVLAELARHDVRIVDGVAGFLLDNGDSVVTLPDVHGTASELLDQILVRTDRMGTWYLHRLTAAYGGNWQLVFVVNRTENEWRFNNTPLFGPSAERPIPPWEDPSQPDRVDPDGWCPTDE